MACRYGSRAPPDEVIKFEELQLENLSVHLFSLTYMDISFFPSTYRDVWKSERKCVGIFKGLAVKHDVLTGYKNKIYKTSVPEFDIWNYKAFLKNVHS